MQALLRHKSDNARDAEYQRLTKFREAEQNRVREDEQRRRDREKQDEAGRRAIQRHKAALQAQKASQTQSTRRFGQMSFRMYIDGPYRLHRGRWWISGPGSIMTGCHWIFENEGPADRQWPKLWNRRQRSDTWYDLYFLYRENGIDVQELL